MLCTRIAFCSNDLYILQAIFAIAVAYLGIKNIFLNDKKKKIATSVHGTTQ